MSRDPIVRGVVQPPAGGSANRAEKLGRDGGGTVTVITLIVVGQLA